MFRLCAMSVVGEEQRQSGERTLRSAGGEAEEDTLVYRVGFPPSSRSPLGSPCTTPARVHRVSLHTLKSAPTMALTCLPLSVVAFAHTVHAHRSETTSTPLSGG
jgi:hypothetical protein